MRSLVRNSVRTRYVLTEACLIGIVSALAALLLKEGVSLLGGYRLKLSQTWGASLTLPLTGLILGFLAGWIIEQLSPEAAGGGISRVKAVLKQAPTSLSVRTAVVKMLGTVLVLGAGLTLGRRGPTVHIGAALADGLSHWVPTSPEHRRQMIAAGAAAGLAAGFNTPIAGVLFVVEELMRDMSGLTLETAIVASFTGAVLSRLFGSADLNLSLEILRPIEGGFSTSAIPWYLLLGIIAGVLGGLFNRGILVSIQIHRRLNLGMHWRIGLMGLLSGLVIALLPDTFHNHAGLREHLMTGNAQWQTVAIAFATHFCLTLLAYGSGAPGGLFAPTLVLGAALGYLVGNGELYFLHTHAEYTYALAGMGAFFTAVVRVPVTAIVIVFELTTDFNLVLPLMITCAIAYLFAEAVSKGSLYEHLLKASGIEFKEEMQDRPFLARLTAADVMQRQVETFDDSMTFGKALKAMLRSRHRGFPVVQDGKLVGIISERDLTKSNFPDQTPIAEVMTRRPITITPESPISDVLYLLNRYKLSRLPVTEGTKLVGIITRTDIIRAEADHLSGNASPLVFAPDPSYVVYQTKAPAIGKGRLLLPLSNPDTARMLLHLAAAMASFHQYELECLHIIPIPRHRTPSQTPINTRASHKLFQQAYKLEEEWDIVIHTQIRVAHDVGQAILETISDRHIDILLMGWQGNPSRTPDKIFGSVVDTLIRQATCDVVLVKLGQNLHPWQYLATRWLVSTAGGPNSQRALQLLPALSSVSRVREFWMCQIHGPNQEDFPMSVLEAKAHSLHKLLHLPVIPIAACSHSIVQAILEIAKTQTCDVIVLGASREGMLHRALHGNIPEAITRGFKGTVILVRGANHPKSEA